jgi:hypothetical protein
VWISRLKCAKADHFRRLAVILKECLKDKWGDEIMGVFFSCEIDGENLGPSWNIIDCKELFRAMAHS